ncbi:Uncharacterised protein [Bordetella pertussis]|nr:Uncharacterised protein [Bordetella pertussis]
MAGRRRRLDHIGAGVGHFHRDVHVGVDARIERDGRRRALQGVGHGHEVHRRLIHLVGAGNARRPHLPDQDHGAGGNEHVVHAGTAQRHHDTGDQRPQAGAHAVGHKQDGAQADTAFGLDVVVGEGGAQRVQGELQHAEYARQRHHRPVRQHDPAPHQHRQQHQHRRVEADQAGAVDAVGQPAHRPLRQQPGRYRGGHENGRLRRGQAVLGGIDGRQPVERAGQVARHEQHGQGQRHTAGEKAQVQRRGQRRGRVRARRHGDRHQAQHQTHGHQGKRAVVERGVGRQGQLPQDRAQAGYHHVHREDTAALVVFGLFVEPAFDHHELGDHHDARYQAQQQPQRQVVDQRLRQDHAGSHGGAGHEGPDMADPDDQLVSQPRAAHQPQVVACDQRADPDLVDGLRGQPQPHIGIEQARADQHQQGREVKRRE